MPPVTIKKPEESLSPTFVSSRVEALQSKSPGTVLAAVGDILRRSKKAGGEVVQQAERALQRLSISEVTSAVVAIDVASCQRAIEQAAEQAFEAAFAETEEERTAFARAAVRALSARDVVESTLVASKRRTTKAEAAALHLAIDEKAAAVHGVDALFAGSVGRSLTGINEERKAALRDLDSTEQDRCPWLTRFGTADDMLQVLGGTKTTGASEPSLSALRASALPAFTVSRGGAAFVAAEASALGRVALGEASSAERGFLESRAKRDESLALALRELALPIDSGDA